MLLAAMGFSANAAETVGNATFTRGDSGEGTAVLNLAITWEFRALTDGLMEYTLTLPDGTVVTQADRKPLLDVVDPREYGESAPPSLGEGGALADNTFVIFPPFGQMWSLDGEYTVTLPEGTVLIDGVPNAEQTLVYTFTHIDDEEEGGGEEAVYMLPATLKNPADYYSSWAPYSIDVTYDNQPLEIVKPIKNENFDPDFDFPTMNYYTYASVSIDGGEPFEIQAFVIKDDPSIWGFEDMEITWDLEVAFWDLDDYDPQTSVELIIPGGIVKNEKGELNPPQTFTFYIMPAFDASLTTWTPESGETVKTSESIKINFDGNDISPLQGVVTYSAWNDETFSFETHDLNWVEDVTISDDNTLVISLENVTPGYWEFSIPEGFVTVNIEEDGEVVEYLSPSIWLEYDVIQGTPSVKVKTIGSENGVYPVYTVNGVRVGDSDATQNLRKGIYIVNGHKVVIK